MPPRPSTARAKLVTTLTEEILSRTDSGPFPIASEHELCRRFDLSRVTVRLALSDLENRGLIYRRHGKGTFAHGCANRVYRNIGFLLAPSPSENRPTAEFVRGLQSYQAEICAGVMLISVRPDEWSADLARMLSALVVRASDAAPKDIAVLRDRNLQYVLIGEGSVPGPRLSIRRGETAESPEIGDYFMAGREVAKALNNAVQTGTELKDIVVDVMQIPSDTAVAPARDESSPPVHDGVPVRGSDGMPGTPVGV